MDQVCISCSKPLPADARFCNFCGAQQPDVQSREVGDAASEVQENRVVTVVFCDLVGSTTLSENLDAEDYALLIERFQTLVADQTRKNKGHVAKFMGDGAMLYFGYPKVVDHAPVRAVTTAKGLIGDINKVGDGILKKSDDPVSIRVGIHTGVVIAGRMGESEFSEERAIVGVTPNIAARLESMAKPGQIVASEQTKRAIEANYQTSDLGMVSLKGLSNRVRVFSVDSVISGTSTDLGLIHGREQQLREIERIWKDVLPGNMARVSLVGEAGMGKTSIATSFIKTVSQTRKPSGSVYCIRGVAEEQASAFRAVFRFAKRELANKDLGQKRLSTARQILSFLSAGSGAGDHGGIDLSKAIADVILQVLDESGAPAILFVEDRQWLDPATCSVLVRLAKSRIKSGLFIIDTGRESDDPMSDVPTHNIDVGPLGEDAALSVVRDVDREGIVPAPIQKTLVERAKGNPFYVEELTRFYSERLRAGESVELEDLFAHGGRLGEVLLARLDGLGPLKQAVLRMSVIGDQFALDEVEHVIETPDATLDTIEKLTVDGVLERIDTQDAGLPIEFQFWNVLVRDVAYGSMLRRNRRPLHLRLAQWMLENPNWRQRWRPEDVARHLTKANKPENAVPFLVEAATAAEALGAYEEAITHARSALDALDGSDASKQETVAARLKAYSVLIPSLIAARGRVDKETVAAFDEAVPFSLAHPGHPEGFAVLWSYWFVGQTFDEMNRRAELLMNAAQKSKSEELEMQSHHCFWAIAFFQGRHKDVLKHVKDGLKLYHDDRDVAAISRFGGHDAKVCGQGELALTNWITGNPSAAVLYAKECIERADELGHRGTLLHGLDYLAVYSLFCRDQRTGMTVIDRLRSLLRETPTEQYRAKEAFFSAWKEGLGEEVSPKTVQSMAEAVYQLATMGVNEDMPVYLATLAENCLRTDNLKGARDALKKARQLADLDGIVFWHPDLSRLEAEVAIAEEAEAKVVLPLYKAGLTLAIEQGAMMLEARLLSSLGKYLINQGRDDDVMMKLTEFRLRCIKNGCEVDTVMSIASDGKL